MDVRVAQVAARQHNRFSLRQALAVGMAEHQVDYRVETGRWVAVHEAVFAISPVIEDDWGRWWGAILTSPGSALSHASAAAARGFWDRYRALETITRPGSGGPRQIDGVRVHRSLLLDDEVSLHRGLPVTTAERTLIDLAPGLSRSGLEQALRVALRTGATTVPELVDAIGRHRGRRGTRKLLLALARWAGVPVERARSGPEIEAFVILRDANRELPELNVKIAGEEADLVWRRHKLIIEIDGGPWHQDVGHDARKEKAWRDAGYTVLRIPAEAIRATPGRLLALAP